ncbi:MAG: hypothetical protein IJJ99_05710 [Oscillospiraceae bacterium]|nr:hypothetical protein [Oscillospiraceae bacterium]
MLFQKRIKRAFDYLEEKKQREAEENPENTQEDLKPSIKDILEKGDIPAMLISAFLVILPIAIIVLLVIVFAGRLFMRA